MKKRDYPSIEEIEESLNAQRPPPPAPNRCCGCGQKFYSVGDCGNKELSYLPPVP